jgi:hypothetical protein
MEQNFFFPENKASLMYGNLKELKFKINKINNNFEKFNKKILAPILCQSLGQVQNKKAKKSRKIRDLMSELIP